jgi:hypothetical protein
LGATVALLSAPRSRWLVLAALLLVAVPAAYAFSTGITKENAPDPAAFGKYGCVSCHGNAAAHEFPAVDQGNVKFQVSGAEGEPLNGPYEAHGVYTITITLDEQNAPEAANHAGFNLRAASGKLSAVDGQSQVSGDGAEATHVGPGRTSWNVTWEAPESGAAVFSLFVNDVDGSQLPDAADEVYWLGYFIGDHEGAVAGAAEEHEVHFGISLQQYWIGLIGLAGMIFVLVAGFVYIKFVNPHNTDHKDR